MAVRRSGGLPLRIDPLARADGDLHVLDAVVDPPAGERHRQRADRTRHHLADVADREHVVGSGQDRVELVEVGGQGGDRAGLQPEEGAVLVDRPLQVERVPLVGGGQSRLLGDLSDLVVAEQRVVADGLATDDLTGGVHAVVIGGGLATDERLAEAGDRVDDEQVASCADGVGGEHDARGARVDHPLHDQVHRGRRPVKMVSLIARGTLGVGGLHAAVDGRSKLVRVRDIEDGFVLTRERRLGPVLPLR